jgi:hypothetical protein
MGWYGNISPTGTLSLPANGGSVMVLIEVKAPMILQSCLMENRDTSGARSWEWRLYVDDNTSVTLSEIPGANGSESFTPVAATTRTAAATGAPITLSPGIYFLVIRNTHATNTFAAGATAFSNTMGNNWEKTKTLGSALGSTLDVDTGWTGSISQSPGTLLAGRILGKSTGGW